MSLWSLLCGLGIDSNAVFGIKPALENCTLRGTNYVAYKFSSRIVFTLERCQDVGTTSTGRVFRNELIRF